MCIVPVVHYAQESCATCKSEVNLCRHVISAVNFFYSDIKHHRKYPRNRKQILVVHTTRLHDN